MAVDFSVANGARINFTALTITSPMSINFWFNAADYIDRENDGIFPQLIQHTDASAIANGWIVQIPTSTTLRFSHWFSTTPGLWTVTLPSLNAVHCMGIAYDNSAVGNNPVIYIDGVSKTVTRVTAPVGTAKVTGCKPCMGSEQDGTSGTFKGKIQDIRFYYGTTLTAAAFALLSGSSRTLEINDGGLTFHAPLMYGAALYPAIPFAGTLGGSNTTFDRIGGLVGTPAGSPMGVADMVYGTVF